MKFEGFDLVAVPRITDAYCKECGEECKEVSNGWFSSALYCPKCETVYVLKMIKVPSKKVSKEFIEQCRKEMKGKNAG